jgi:hypothetical protein
MQAIQGYYDNGIFELAQEMPVRRTKFILYLIDDDQPIKPIMTQEEALRIFHKYSGSVDRDIDIEKERDEYLNEKYGPFN